MVVFSIIFYVGVLFWFFVGNDKSQRISMIIGTCVSSFLACWYLDISNWGVAIYSVLGLICVLLFWVYDDSKETKNNKIKNKYIAAILAIILGSFGVHRFYLKKNTSGLLYLLFCWSFIPGVFGVLEAIRFLVISKSKFDILYNSEENASISRASGRDAQPEQTSQEIKLPWDDEEDDEDDFEYNNSDDEQSEEKLNYPNIRLCGYKAAATGTLEDFIVTIKTNGQSYSYKVKNGDICSFRSSSMRTSKSYEVM